MTETDLPKPDVRGTGLGDWVTAMYRDEWLKHRDCDPPCIDAADARRYLIACGIDPDQV